MRCEWKRVKLKDCCYFKEGYVNPPQTYPEYFDGDIKWIRAVDLNDSYVYTTSRTLSQIGFESAKKSAYLFPPDSIVISKSGTIGRLGIIKDYMCGNRATINIQPKENINLFYLFYFLRSKQREFANLAVGSVQKNLYISILEEIEIDLPSLQDQKRIAVILSSLDDKIELNNKINENLERQAQALYKHYFPYSIDDELPDGWRIGTAGEIIEIHDSKRIPLSGAERSKMGKRIYPYYGAASLMDFVDDYIFDGKYLLLGEDGTVVDNAGYPILQYVWGQFWVNNHAHILTGKLGFNVESLYMLFKQTPVKSIVTGAVQPKISQANLRSIQVIVPPEKLLIEYNCRVEPLFSLLRTNKEENKSLTVLRDTLLPKLISGEIDVSDLF